MDILQEGISQVSKRRNSSKGVLKIRTGFFFGGVGAVIALSLGISKLPPGLREMLILAIRKPPANS